MQLKPEISFRGLEPSPAIERKVRERLERLDRRYQRIMGCSVMIESHHRHHNKGNLYHVRIALTVPGSELVVSRNPNDDHSHEDAYVVVRDAFDAMERQLEDFARRQRGDVKTHEVPDHGRVTELDRDHGFLTTSEGRVIYFHANSVIDGGFGKLGVGDEVRFVEAPGEEGPQISTTIPVGKHHPVG